MLVKAMVVLAVVLLPLVGSQGGAAVGVEQDAGLAIATAVFLATVANRLVEGMIKPIWEKVRLDSFWLMYVAWLMGGVLVWFSGVNLFAAYIQNGVVGQVLTAILCGGGANLINDLFSKKGGQA